MGQIRYGDVGRLISLAKTPDLDYFLLQQQGIDLGFEVRNRVKTGFPSLGISKQPNCRFSPVRSILFPSTIEGRCGSI